MTESSRRAARAARKGGLPNAGFIVAAAESPPAELARLADLVTVRFPWGSLLRGVVGRDAVVAEGLASLVAPDGRIELLLAPMERDGLDGVPTVGDGLVAGAAAAFRPHGFEIDLVESPTAAAIRGTGSTWARRLGRDATLIRLLRR
jgi:16S rRNA (adenine(1408)-N(1))-methyltransferase